MSQLKDTNGISQFTNKHITGSKLFDRVYCVVGDDISEKPHLDEQPAIGYFAYNDEGSLQHQGNIPIHNLLKARFTPTKVVLHQSERKMVMLNESNPCYVYICDLEKGKVIEEWKPKNEVTDISPITKHAAMTDNQMIYGLNRNSMFLMDGRLPYPSKLVDSKQLIKKTVFNLNVIATSGEGFIATGSKDGTIRLHEKIEKKAKTCLSFLKNNINYLEISEDGRWILATCDECIMIIPTVVGASNRSGFLGRGMGKLKPNPYVLRLKQSDIEKYQMKQVSFIPAHFDHGLNITEQWIISSTGPYIVKWDFNKIKTHGILDAYSITKAASTIVGVEFRFGKPDSVLVAEARSIYALNSSKKKSNHTQMNDAVWGPSSKYNVDTDHLDDAANDECKDTKQEQEAISDPEVEEVKMWLKSVVKLPQYIAVFVDSGYDSMIAVATLTEQDMVDIEIKKKGHRKKILFYIQKYNESATVEENKEDDEGNQGIDPIEGRKPQIAGKHIEDTSYFKAIHD
eukprot:202978_1